MARKEAVLSSQIDGTQSSLSDLLLLREVHELLMAGVCGGDKAPGEFRRSQIWLGGTRPGNARFVGRSLTAVRPPP